MRLLKKDSGVVGVQVISIDPPFVEGDKTTLTEELTAIAHRVADKRVVLDLRGFGTFGEDDGAFIVDALRKFTQLDGKLHFVLSGRGVAYFSKSGLNQYGRTFAGVEQAVQSFVPLLPQPNAGTEVA